MLVLSNGEINEVTYEMIDIPEIKKDDIWYIGELEEWLFSKKMFAEKNSEIPRSNEQILRAAYAYAASWWQDKKSDRREW